MISNSLNAHIETGKEKRSHSVSLPTFLLNGSNIRHGGHFNSQTQTNRRHWTPVSHRGHGASRSISHFFSIALQLRWSFSFLTASFFCSNRLYKQWRTQSYPSWPESSRFSLGIHVLSDRWISNAAADVNQPKIDTEHAWGWRKKKKTKTWKLN